MPLNLKRKLRRLLPNKKKVDITLLIFKLSCKKAIFKRFFIFILIISWLFSGWPQIYNFPPTIPQVQADSTTVFASSNSADGSLTGWTNPTYVYSDDGVNYATRAGTTKNQWYGTLYGFDLSGIPDGAIINSVTITAEWHNSAADTSGPVLYLGAKSGGSEVGTGTSDTSGQTGDEVVTNAPTGLTAANLKATGASGFWAILRFRRTDNTVHTASVDYVKVAVNYTPIVVPTVSTQAAGSVEATTATGNGTIDATGGENASAWGVCYKTSSSCTTADSTAAGSGSGGTGAFTASMTSLSSGTTYYIKAYATNSAGTSYGSEVTILTKPAAPTSLNFTSVTETTLRLNWTASTGAASYKVERCTGTGCSSWSEIASGVTNTYYDDSGRTGNTVYRYQVRATNATGDSAYSSGAEQLMLPGAPTALNFTNVQSTSLRLNWTAPTGGATSYKVERCTGSGCSSFSEITSGETNTYYDNSSLTCNTLYRYRVRATNATPADGAYSSITEQTTSACGSITTDIVNGSYVSVSSPTMAMNSVTFSLICQTATGSFGTASEQIYVNNNDAADGGWTLTLAAQAATNVWDSAGTDFDFNEAGSSGCADDGATTDADSLGGQMTVDPSGATLNIGQCGGCSTTGVSLGDSESFVEGSNNDIDILNGAANSDDIGDWTVQGVSISQKIPAEQPAASDYDINMVLTVTAI